jgi:hypothetical protein
LIYYSFIYLPLFIPPRPCPCLPQLQKKKNSGRTHHTQPYVRGPSSAAAGGKEKEKEEVEGGRKKRKERERKGGKKRKEKREGRKEERKGRGERKKEREERRRRATYLLFLYALLKFGDFGRTSLQAATTARTKSQRHWQEKTDRWKCTAAEAQQNSAHCRCFFV